MIDLLNVLLCLLAPFSFSNWSLHHFIAGVSETVIMPMHYDFQSILQLFGEL
jgi:hypothetical protein